MKPMQRKDFFENMDEPTVTYLIGELYRRLGKPEEAATRFSKVINSRAALKGFKVCQRTMALSKRGTKKDPAS